jgi:hypothetical protein
LKQTLRASERLVDLAGQLAQAGLEDGALGLRVGCQHVESPPQVLLCLHQPRLEARHGLGTLAFETLRDLRELALEALRAGVADLREPLSEDCLRLTGECLDRPVELT